MLRTTVYDIASAVLGETGGAEILQIAVDRTARLFPGARVAAIRVTNGGHRAKICAVAGTPESWVGTEFDIDQASTFTQAIRDPALVAHAAADDARAAYPGVAPIDSRPCDLACAAISSPTGADTVLAAWTDPSTGEGDEIARVLLTVTRMVGAANTSAQNAAERRCVHQAITRAKQEWECTVDALPELVCVLDGDGTIVRTNRAVETWLLGRVREVQGRAIHELLHPECEGTKCLLAASLDKAWQVVKRKGASRFELHDPRLGRYLDVTLRTIGAGASAVDKPSGDLAVIVVTDITMLHSIQSELQVMNEELETRIEARTSEVNASREELSLLSAQLMTAQEDERKRIAQELHDCIGQSLSAIKYSLERAEDMTHQQDPSAPRHLLRTTISRVQETIESIRAIAMDLRPSMLDDFGPVSAVRWLCQEFREVYDDIKVHTNFAITDDDIPKRLGTPIFRTVQESLNNIAKHAKAKNVFVSMRGDVASLALEIRDDGVGFELKEIGRPPQKGTGLSGLRERAGKTGGKFSVRSKRHAGTVVRVGWPLDCNTAPVGPSEQKAFTLLELLVVMVIIGILAGFVAPRYFAQVGKSQVRAAMAQIDALDKALDQYRIDMGRYPTSEEGLDVLTNAPPDDPEWTGPYLKKAVPPDPWGRPYVYVSPGTHGDVDIISYGKDGQPGGIGENADITSW